MRLSLLQRALRRRLLADMGRLRLNRRDPLGAGRDFSHLDALADELWRETDLAGGIWAVMAIELLLFVFLLLLGWKSNRTWPIWAAAFQSVTVLVHVVVMIDFRIRAIAYISAYTVGTYGVLISVAVGTVQAWRLKRAMGDVNKLRGLSSSD